jgi:hypothetical protein
MDYNIETATIRSISGWCVGDAKLVEVRCLQHGEVISKSKDIGQRFDVESAFPRVPHARHSGFALACARTVDPVGECCLEFVFDDGSTVTSRCFGLEGALTLPPWVKVVGGDDIHYLLFLRKMFQSFQFIERFFPKYNERVEVTSKDALSVASSAVEMLHIADQIYRIHARGGTGSVCEFGCFKGFSTACLSHACFDLGVPLEVFDSFEGLPDAGSDYYRAGDFCGTLEEVKANVARFGKPEVVRFNQGFFVNTLSKSTVNPLLIWMDVDLQSSSRDVMSILKKLPKQSCVLSHECFARNFDGDEIVPDQGVGDVISPIVEAMRKEGWEALGTWLAGGLGAFWDRKCGEAPLAGKQLLEALRLSGTPNCPN